MELIQGQYYWDEVNHVSLIFENKIYEFYWFYCINENRDILYYPFELKNLRRY